MAPRSETELTSIRPLSGNEADCPEGKVFEIWGSMEALTFVTGESALLNIGTRIQDQVEWLQRFDPDYLLTYPGNCNLLRTQQNSLFTAKAGSYGI